MKPSQFRKDGDDFLAVWETAGIGIGFSRIRETDSGMLYAELDVQSIRPDASGTLLSPSRFNLMAATERKRLADLLQQRAADIPWVDALESAIGRVITEFRTPEPLVDLWDVEDPGELRYLFRPLLVENDTNVWYADEQSLKSYLAMVCAASAVSGIAVDGIGPASRTGPVLYYDWETFDQKQRRRLTRVVNGLGLGVLRDIKYRRMTRPLVDVIGLIRAEASRLGAVLVIFDSLAWMCNGDINKPEIALPAMNAVGSIQGVTRLVLAHHGKSGRNDGETPTVFGSAFFEAGSRNRWLIKKSQDEGAETIKLGLYHRKSSDDERHPTMGLAFTFDRSRDAVTVAPCSVEDDPELLRNASPATKILAMLRETEFSRGTVAEIAKETGIPSGSVKRHLLQMDGGRVKRLEGVNSLAGGRGNSVVWGLLAKPFKESVHPIDREKLNGFSPATRKNRSSEEPKPFESVHGERFPKVEDDEELPF